MGFVWHRDELNRATSGSFDHIVRAAKVGDQDAVSVLYLNHVAMVYGYLRACMAQEPEDLTSEVFLGMLRGLARFDGNQPDFRRWLMTIAHRRLVDQRRSQAVSRVNLTEPSSLEAVEANRDLQEIHGAKMDSDLVAAFGSLTDAQREVLALRFIADVSLRGVASITGRPRGAVKSLQNRGLQSLRRHMSDPRAEQEV